MRNHNPIGWCTTCTTCNTFLTDRGSVAFGTEFDKDMECDVYWWQCSNCLDIHVLPVSDWEEIAEQMELIT